MRVGSHLGTCASAAWFMESGRPRLAWSLHRRVDIEKSMWTDNYVFAKLTRETIGKLSDWKLPAPTPTPPNKSISLVYKIWHDQTITRCVYESVRTIKCDAARNTFQASGKGIVWAVADTGIDATHPHFKSLKTIEVPGGLMHKDFTESHPLPEKSQAAALTDQAGHGTHVAGIIAGLTCRRQDNVPSVATAVAKIVVKMTVRDGNGNVETVDREYTEPIAGLARDCKLLSLKALTDGQSGDLSNLLAALGYIQRCNDNGRSLKIHGVNLKDILIGSATNLKRRHEFQGAGLLDLIGKPMGPIVIRQHDDGFRPQTRQNQYLSGGHVHSQDPDEPRAS